MVANLSLSLQNPAGVDRHIQAALIEEPARSGTDMWLMLAHDLRNPLIAMQRVIEIAITDSRSDHTRSMLTQAHTNCDLLLEMLTDVLDSHRPQSYAKPLGRQEASPAVIVERCSSLVQALLAEKGISLRSCAPPDLASVAADERTIVRVLTNLVHNALKASPVGGVIEVSVEEGSDDSLVFSVKDYGSGIPPDEADRIFEMNYQCAPSQGAQRSGYGWGLYYCKKTIEALGGDIWVEFSEGGAEKGTVISFTVPAC
jgi:signal transduction histidine kinase